MEKEKQISLERIAKMESILEMKGATKWLSNYEACTVEYEGIFYNSSEAAYQAAKTLDPEVRKTFVNMTPKEARINGGLLKLRPDWDSIKYDIMYQVVLNKFSANPYLKERLINTGYTHLEEGNHHGDMYWGTVDGKGFNNLGIILMDIRKILQEEQRRYNMVMKTIYCVHPISGLSADKVFAYYTNIKQNLSNHYNVMIPMTGKSSLRCAKEFRCEGYQDNPITTNHAIFERDRWMVTQSDIIYANLIGATEKVSIGSMFELAWASLLGKYVVLVMDKESVHRHAFVMEAADVIFESEQVAEDYLITLANGTI